MAHASYGPPATLMIDYPHERVHDGVSCQASYKSPEGADVADNGSIVFAVLTGRRYPHTVFEFHSGGDSEVAIYEGATFSANGTGLPAWNMLRTSIFTPSTRVHYTPSITTNGVMIHNSLIPGGTGNFSGGSVARSGSEWLLKPNTNYMVQLINRAGSSQPMSIVMQWYEEEPA